MKHRKLHILLISPLFYPEIGGSQQYMEDLYHYLTKQYKELSVDVLAYNTQKTNSYEKYRGLNIYRLPAVNILAGQFALANPFSLMLFLWRRKEEYDLIHCNTRFFDSSWWAPIYAKLFAKKIVLTDHCASHPKHSNLLISKIAQFIDLTLVKTALGMFDQIYCISKSTQVFIKHNYNMQTKLIYGGINDSVFKPVKKISRTNKVIFVGRMINSKGARIAFESAKQVTNADFTFIGPGPLVQEFQNEIKQQKIKNIKVLGGLYQEATAEFMSKADILINPSSHHEGIPTVLKEAGACKLAVIATDVGGSKEIIINNKTGLLIPQNDPIALKESLVKLLNNKNLQKKLSDNLYQLTKQKFSWKKSSKQQYKYIVNLVKP